MVKKNQPFLSTFVRSFPEFSWTTLLLVLAVWGASGFMRSKGGAPYTVSVFLKGGGLLILAWAIYITVFRRSKHWVVFLPLGWLASSGSLWEICYIPETRFRIWLVLFLILVLIVIWIRDGRIFLILLLLLSGALSWLFKFSFLVPLSCSLASKDRGTSSAWLLGSTLAVTIGWFLFLHGYYYWVWNGSDFWDLWIGQRMGVFLLMAMAGTLGGKELFFGDFRPASISFLLVVLGTLVWGGRDLIGLWQSDLLVWLAILFAGFGWVVLRRELLGDKWFHQALGHAIGIALWCSAL